ncbi:hypothetical protein CHS0354_022565 [Potamilus streckersoni]|uniref:Uncharacterized protein n=1 Tax=Potamilus streckersoni TaxID=2493646 RepID=A0AAE0TBR6_9BIVA|nr:hypothetical protein CHS0354_022565 [Potamilus streckersoni]
MISKVDSCKGTPAHYVAYGSNVFVFQYLVSQGMDPSSKTSSQETLLHLLYITGQLEMTQYFVEKYLDMITEVDNCKETPGHCAVWNRNICLRIPDWSRPESKV